MPRTARIAVNGVFYHVLFRGIERRDLFLDDEDRAFFCSRLSSLLVETGTECRAWALMPNHGHLLICPRQDPLATLMARLLTAHAVRFNQRHQRAGHLFQNRFLSLPCPDESALLARVRYIHLNPVRAGLVGSLGELDSCPWTGHAVIMGLRKFPGQDTSGVLDLFGGKLEQARARYRRFLKEGLDKSGKTATQWLPSGGIPHDVEWDLMGRREEAVERLKEEERVLRARIGLRPSLEEVIRNQAERAGVPLEDLLGRGRTSLLARARAEICRQGVRDLAFSATEVARALRVDDATVSRLLRKR